MNVSGLKRVPMYLPDMVCMTWNESTATPHASGKTKSQTKRNNRMDSLPMRVSVITTSGRAARRFGRFPKFQELMFRLERKLLRIGGNYLASLFDS